MNFTLDKRTKIVTTIGPASETYEIISSFFDAGMTTIRLNFSHGTHEEQISRAKIARQISLERKLPISIMLDTKGPEIRVGKFVTGKQLFLAHEEVKIFCDEKSYLTKECANNEMAVSYDFSKDISVGKIVLIDDGKLQIIVKEIKGSVVVGVTKNKHLVKNNKRINLPGTKFSMPFLSEKDIMDVRLAAHEGWDYIAASFVNSADDIMQIRKILKEEKTEYIKIISKIESQYAVDNFDEILEESDGIMVARGDLGLEIPYYDVPVAQKMMIRKARAVGKPIIVATQMLDSMENNPHPTRAEVTDVYFAVELGADATMLSGESAAGVYPVEAVQVMATIDKRAEVEFYNKIYYNQYIAALPKEFNDPRREKAVQVALKAKDGDYKYAVVLSRTGALLTAIAAVRPNTNILGISLDQKQYTLHGVTSSVFMYHDHAAFNAIKNDINKAIDVVKHFGGKKGEKFLVVENTNITEFVL